MNHGRPGIDGIAKLFVCLRLLSQTAKGSQHVILAEDADQFLWIISINYRKITYIAMQLQDMQGFTQRLIHP